MITQKTSRICQEYWNRQLPCHANEKTEVSCHHSLYAVNKFSLLSDSFDVEHKTIIKQADNEFKELKPLERNMTIWRGIGIPNKHSFLYSQYIQNLFDKANSLKLNDKIIMSEYAYAGYRLEDAEMYAGINGIVYKINVPKGAKISRNKLDVTLPRYSEFVCRSIDKHRYYKIITLDYILKAGRQGFSTKQYVSAILYKIMQKIRK